MEVYSAKLRTETNKKYIDECRRLKFKPQNQH